jgi:hypothetical protein
MGFDIFNFAVVTLIGLFPATWIITGSLINYHEPRERMECESRLQGLIGEFSFINRSCLTAADLIKHLEDDGLLVTTLNSPVVIAQFIRYRVSVGLLTSLCLIFSAVMTKNVLGDGLHFSDSQTAAWWLTLLCSIVNLCCYAYLGVSSTRLEFWPAMKTLAKAGKTNSGERKCK